MLRIYFLEADTIDTELPEDGSVSMAAWLRGLVNEFPTHFQVHRDDTMATQLIWNGELVNTTENRGESARALLEGCESLHAVGFGDTTRLRRNMVDKACPVEATCPICLEDYGDDGITRLSCDHLFHTACILLLVNTDPDIIIMGGHFSLSCPLCRTRGTAHIATR